MIDSFLWVLCSSYVQLCRSNIIPFCIQNSFTYGCVLQVSGVALIVVGAVVKTKYGDFIQLSDSNAATGPVFLIIIGVIVAIVGFLGCCGAYKENYCMVTTVRMTLIFQNGMILLAVVYISIRTV